MKFQLSVCAQVGYPARARARSSERFSATWKATISVLVAKGRARVGVAAAAADWPKRIRDLQSLDHEGYATAT